MKLLRPYQSRAIDTMRDGIRGGKFRRPILQARCGAGKTLMAIHMMRNAVDRGKSCLFIVHRRGLVENCCEKLVEEGLPFNVIMAGARSASDDHPIKVASRDTLTSRALRGGGELPPADLLVIDEAHLATGAQYRELMKRYPDSFVVALTATPAGPNGTGLSDVFDCIVRAATAQELLADGFIVPTTAFGPFRIDLSGIKVVRGDYAPDQLAERMDTNTLVGDIVQHWKDIAEDRPTVAFATRRSHAEHIRDIFTQAGVTAAYVDGTTSDDDRKQIKRDMERGRIKVVANVDILSIGTDWPFLSCLIDAAPTRSLVRFLQRAGRIARPSNGKAKALYLDHADNCLRLKVHPDDDFDWPLHKSQKAKPLNPDPRARELKFCPNCSAMYYGGSCPNCGAAKSKQFKVEAGALVEITPGKEYTITVEDKERVWNTTLAQAANLGWRFGRASAVYKSKTGDWPKGLSRMPGGSKWPADISTYEWWTLPVANVFPGFVRGKAKR